MIHISHPRRNKLNHLTQTAMSDLDFIYEPSSNHYKAMCWIFNDDLLFDDYEVCDGTLLQRYVLALFFHSYNLVENYQHLGSSHTCDWPGISCDQSDTFVTKIDLHDQKIKGTLLTEIGLLERLEYIDLSGNKLSGSIDHKKFSYMPLLETFNIANNDINDEIPMELLMLPQIKDINIANNRFVGSLPSDIHYSKTLGELHYLIQ